MLKTVVGRAQGRVWAGDCREMRRQQAATRSDERQKQARRRKRNGAYLSVEVIAGRRIVEHAACLDSEWSTALFRPR
jgi:hypothetical protein